MNPTARTGRPTRTVFARLVLLAGLMVALVLALGGPAARLGRARPIASTGGQGYWLLARDGGIFGYGDAAHRGTNLNAGNDAIGLAPTPTMRGYWIADDDGTVFAYGDANDYGSRVSIVDDVRGFAPRPQGDGYWLVTRDGAVYAFGAAPYRGNTPALGAAQKIVGMASTPSGNGYWLVGRDGGMFAFGDAAFHGSTGGTTLNRPIVGMARTPSGNGYWFVASDGGVFAFGGAGFHGAAVGSVPAGDIVGITPTASGNGYWLVGSNGKVFPYGDAANYGDASGLTLRQPIAGIAATPVVHANSVPAPVGDSASVAEDGSAGIDVMGNDAGLDDGPIAVEITGAPAHGSASVGAGKKINYTPAADYNGADSITYKVTDGDGESATAVVSLAVTAVNDVPVVQSRTLGTSEDSAAGGTLNGSDTDGDSLTYSVVAQPAHGTVSVSGSSFTYTPAADYNGADSFTFRANDGSANSNTATVSVTVSAVADAPVATNLSVSTDEDTPLSGSPSGSDADGDVLSFAIVTPPAHGELSGPAGSYTYTPDADFNGTDSFTYTTSDGALTSAPATVSVTVTPVNDAPVATAGTAGTDEDTILAGTLASTDIDGGAATYSISTDPQHGSVTVDGDGYTYTPAANYHGADSFAFVANDGSDDSAPATVGITVDSIEDAPVFDEENGAGSGTGGFIDIAASGTELANHGDDLETSVALPFPVSFYGTTYDGNVEVSSNGWISFDGSHWGYSNRGLSEVSSPVAFPFWDDLRTDQGDDHGIWTEVTGSAPSRKFIVQWNVTHYGSGGATVRFEAIFTEGSPVVEFHYNDVLFGHSADNGAEATVGVVKDGTTYSQFSLNSPSLTNGLFLRYDTSTNLSSVGSDNETVTDEDSPLELDVPATDGDGDVLTYAISGAAGHGTAVINPVNGHVTYTPALNYNGDDTFTVSVTDGHSAPVTKDVTVTVNPVNDAPAIDQAGPLAASIDEDSSTGVVVAVTAADVDTGDSLTWSASDPDHGTVTGGGSTGDFTYVPDADFDGSESFTVTVTDGGGATDTIQVDVTVENLNNDAPVVSAIASQSMNEDGTLEIAFTASDPDTGDVLDITAGSSDPTLLPTGSLSLGGTGTDRTLTVSPAANLSGEAHLFLMVSDGEAAPQLQDIVLTVNPVNDLPVADAGTLTTDEDVPGGGTLTGDDPVEHSALAFSLSGDNGGAEHGTVTITDPSTGVYTYEPDADFNGSDSFSFMADDGSDNSDPATISVTIGPVADAPAFDGTGNSGRGNEETVISGTVSATDADAGDTLTYSIEPGGGPGQGTASVDGATGEWSYTGHDDFAGADSFTVTVTDGDGLTDTILVNVSVDNVNDAPSFNAGGAGGSGDEDTAITGTVSASDPDAGDTLAYSIEDGNGAADGAASVDQATGAWSYTGNPDFNGSDSFTITVTDGGGETDTVVVNVTVDPVNDAPSFDGSGNSGAGNEEAAISGTVVATDVENDAPSYSIEAGDEAASGSASVDAGTGAWSYTGNLNFFGSDSFTITVSDGNGGTDTIGVSLTVANVNDAPVVSAVGARSTDEDVNLHIPFTVADADPTDVVSITVGSSNPTLLPVGAVTVTTEAGNSRTLHIAPAANKSGTAQVFVSVSDGHAAPVIQSVSLTVNPVNDIPVAYAGNLSTNEDQATAGTLAGSDPVEGSALTYSLEGANGGALHGTVSITDAATGAYSYTPAADYHGADSFSFVANDGADDSLPASVAVTVIPVNDAPAAVDGNALVVMDAVDVAGTLPAASDPDTGDTLTYAVVSQPQHGSVVLLDAATGDYEITTEAGYIGADSFTYKVSDGTLDSNTATISLVIGNTTPEVDGPASGSTFNLDSPLSAARGQVVASDLDGDTLTYAVVAGPGDGSISYFDPATGNYEYTTNSSSTTDDSFEVTVSDGVHTVPVTVTIHRGHFGT